VSYKLAAAGEGTIKIYSLSNQKELKQERIELPRSSGRVSRMQWSQNGQLLLVATQSGALFGLQTQVSQLTSVCGSLTAELRNFTVVAISDSNADCTDNKLLVEISLETEPGFLALGPCHVAVGINSSVWFY